METSHQTPTPPCGEGLTFEKVWASLMELKEFQKETAEQIKAMSAETAEQIKAMSAETDRKIKETAEQMKETDKQMKETGKQMKETDRKMKETDRRVGELTDRFGVIVERMVVPNLVARFQELGFTFTKVSRNIKINDKKNRILAEVDAFLENGDKVMVVEIKSKPKTDYINDHVERLEKLRAYADLHNDKRKYLGAVAGVVFDEGVKIYALKNGFYVLEPSGETFSVTRPDDRGYTPKEW
ncbi:MAG: hypothetical protein LBF83_06235 [Spirochaetaceae bacterium]|jgi:hypothetical protein|nr:hypothetical protein [Spirochaetaceae bacterium]